MRNVYSHLSVKVAMVISLCSIAANGLFLRHMMNSSLDDESPTHLIKVTHVSPPHERDRRAADYLSMPSDLHFICQFQGQEIHLRLKRATSRNFRNLFPLYILQRQGPSRKQQLPFAMINDIGFYRLKDQERIMMVNRSRDSVYSLEGHMDIGGKEYLISPNHPHQGEGHSISRVRVGRKFGSDILLIPTGHRMSWPRAPTAAAADDLDCPVFMFRFIELAMVTDFAIYQRFMEFTDNRRLASFLYMYLYYSFVSLSVAIRFDSLQEYCSLARVKVIPVSLTVCTRAWDCPWSEDHVVSGTRRINIKGALPAFRSFAASSNAPSGDHRMFFSGYNLAQANGNTGVLGVAYLGTACNKYWDVSMVQETYAASTGSIAAHELGHGFSARHDDNAEGCSSSDRFVMTSFISFPSSDEKASRPYQFSKCSAANIFGHLTGSKGVCTKTFPRSNMRTQFKAGQFFDADRQCELIKGTGSRFCRLAQKYRDFSTMCVGTMCSNPDNPVQCTKMIPFQYTSCGDRKWCENGRCVTSLRASKTPHDDCPQGDDPRARCRLTSSCTNSTMIDVVCCKTCRIFHAQCTPITFPSSMDASLTSTE